MPDAADLSFLPRTLLFFEGKYTPRYLLIPNTKKVIQHLVQNCTLSTYSGPGTIPTRQIACQSLHSPRHMLEGWIVKVLFVDLFLYGDACIERLELGYEEDQNNTGIIAHQSPFSHRWIGNAQGKISGQHHVVEMEHCELFLMPYKLRSPHPNYYRA